MLDSDADGPCRCLLFESPLAAPHPLRRTYDGCAPFFSNCFLPEAGDEESNGEVAEAAEAAEAAVEDEGHEEL